MIRKHYLCVLAILCVSGGVLTGCRSAAVSAQPINRLDEQSGAFLPEADLLAPSVPPAATVRGPETQTPAVDDTAATDHPQPATPSGGQGNDQPAENPAIISTNRPPLPPVETAPPAAGVVPTSGVSSAQIISFTASPAQVNPGGTVTLSWQAVGTKADVATYSPDGSSTYQSIPLTGTRTITLPASQRYSISFSLTVSGDNATSDNETASVEILCSDTWFFGEYLDPYSLCPLQPKVSDATMQTFEHGFMMWIKAEDLIYAFVDGSSYISHVDNWEPPMPESDPTIVPPSGFYQPLRGFGLAWRDWTVFVNDAVLPLRDTIGWATSPEIPFQAVYQLSAGMHPRSGRLATCLYQDANGRIIALYFGGMWKIVKG